MYTQYSNDSRGDPTVEAWLFTQCEEDGCEGYGWLEIDVHEIVETERSGTLAVYYRQWFNPEGERLWSRKRVIGNLASLRAVIQRRKMRRRAAEMMEAEQVAGDAEPVVIHRQSAGQVAEASADWPVQREGC
ncbi:hypothetical protein HY78_08785 [Rhizorhabdus wittichii DC-6]|nr:hypothetical protein HY78_08785 [Rhizorhabdus wittichii DC-6]